MAFVVAYIILAIICAFYGQNTRMGFWGVLILSVVFTPILVFACLFLLSPDARLNTLSRKEAK